MSTPEPQTVRQASRNALKVVYYVIIGLAITEAMSQVFLQDGRFVGFAVFGRALLPSALLLLAHLVTVTRLVHGASIHLDALSKARYKPLIDFVGFFNQAALFYLMALSLDRAQTFFWLFILMLMFDALWILFLRYIGYIQRLQETEKQWLASDVLLIVTLGNVLLLYPRIGPLAAAMVAGIAAVLAAVCDYRANWRFYFPELAPEGTS